MERSYTVSEIDRMRAAMLTVEKDQTGAILQSYILAHSDPEEVIALYQKRSQIVIEQWSRDLQRRHEWYKTAPIFASVTYDPEPTPKRPWYAFWS